METNMQQKLQNMHKIWHKICQKYAEYAKTYAKYVRSKNILSLSQNMQNMQQICKICKSKFNMQNMHSPLCWWNCHQWSSRLSLLYTGKTRLFESWCTFAAWAWHAGLSIFQSAIDIMPIYIKRSSSLKVSHRRSLLRQSSNFVRKSSIPWSKSHCSGSGSIVTALSLALWDSGYGPIITIPGNTVLCTSVIDVD